tara:strand:- start:450 stop:935 length:486 start_codon:yes stop_codon:yes gene_type:complete
MYTIQIRQGGEEKRDRVLDYLRKRIAKEGRFTADLHKAMDGRLPSIHLTPVRLVKAKLYDGQQPGGNTNPFYQRVQKKTRYLGWNDWVRFHGLVNRVLNRFRTDANVWTNPPYIQGKFWIRKGKHARVRYDVGVSFDRFGRQVSDWNPGDESQFVKDMAVA